MTAPRQVLIGAFLVLLYTLVISGADAITKQVAQSYAAPQLFAFSGFLVIVLSWVVARAAPSQRRQTLATNCPKAMALRSGLTVVGSVAFFYAFRLLPLAEVFLFIGLMPVFAGLISAPLLGESVRPIAWAALITGFVGVVCLFPAGLSEISAGHLVALIACICGALSLCLARYISKFESNSLAQVFYPNLALALCMMLALPFEYEPMPLGDLAWVAGYGVLLFAARWLSVLALRFLSAYAMMPLMNVQFIWMVILGALLFGEFPAANVYLGAFFVIGSGLVLILDQAMPDGMRLPRLREDAAKRSLIRQ